MKSKVFSSFISRIQRTRFLNLKSLQPQHSRRLKLCKPPVRYYVIDPRTHLIFSEFAFVYTQLLLFRALGGSTRAYAPEYFLGRISLVRFARSTRVPTHAVFLRGLTRRSSRYCLYNTTPVTHATLWILSVIRNYLEVFEFSFTKFIIFLFFPFNH